MNIGQLGEVTTLYGGAGNDVLVVLTGAAGDYSLKPLVLNDWDSNDVIVLSTGDLAGDFRLRAQDHLGTYALTSGGGNDHLIGSEGMEMLTAFGGNDLIDGGAGNDTLDGGDGADFLFGGEGNDLLVGGAGADVFVLSLGHDTVLDFTPGLDRVDITGSGIASFAELWPHLSQVGADVVCTFTFAGDTHTLTLANVILADRSASDFGLSLPPVANDTTELLAEDTADIQGAFDATDEDSAGLTYTVLSGPNHGTFDVQDGLWTYVPDPDFAGTDTVTWKANDGVNDSAVATITFEVLPINDEPVATYGLAFAGAEDAPIIGQLTATDVDSTVLTYAVVDGPQYGALVLSADGSFTYTPAADWSGEDSFTYAANDGQLDSLPVSVSLSVAPANDAPVALAGSTDGAEDTQITGAVFADDPEGDALTYALVSDAQHGLLVLNADGTFSYTPEANFFGTDSFSFVANDGTVDSAPQVFTITVMPDDSDAAVITGTATATVNEAGTPGAPDKVVNGQLLADDPDGPTSFEPAALAGTYGSLAIDATGAWTYTLDQNAAATQALAAGVAATDSFTVRTADGTEATVTITVNGADDATVFGGQVSGTVAEAALPGAATQVSGVLTATDPDGGEALAAQTVTGAYGTFVLAANGSWTYAVDNANPAVDALSAGGTLADTVTVSALDGTTQAIAITITGADDIRNGTNGADTLTGTGGNDTLVGGAGNDTLIGGAGIDTASYAGASGAVSVNLLTGAVSGADGSDVLSGIENLTGSAFNDLLVGDAGNNALNGGGGDDTLEGGAGDDSLNGSTGIDTASYAAAAAGVTVSLAVTTAQNTVGAGIDTLTAMENFTGSAFADLLTGSTAANVIDGGSGNDTIDGGAGNDTLAGSGGINTLSFATAGSAVIASLAAGTASGGSGADVFSGFENLTSSAFNDSLTGDGAANTILGGLGNDTVTYASATAAVTVSLAVTAAQVTGGAGSDVLSGIENLTGSAFNDTLTGSSVANVINGGAGNDRIIGGGGADQLTGGSGNDTFVFTATADSTPAVLDTITDFTAGADKIDLSAIDAIPGGADNAFAWGGTAAVARGVWYAYDNAAKVTRVYGDTDGNAATIEFQVELAGKFTLAAADFVL